MSSGALNYYVSYTMNYEGQDIRLDFSYMKEDHLLSNIYLFKENDESLIRIYDEEEGKIYYTAEERRLKQPAITGIYI